MGTRNLTIIYADNEYKVAQYGQWDGHITCTGVEILKFIKSHDLNYFKEKLNNCKIIDEETYASLWKEFGIDLKIEKWVDYNVGIKFDAKYPTLSRDIGWRILEEILSSSGEFYIRNEIEFAADSLMCEYAYVIDFGQKTFEIYTGFNKEPLTESDRFYFLQKEVSKDNEYYPVKLFKKYSFNALPTVEELEELKED